jgi:hypothetical protein
MVIYIITLRIGMTTRRIKFTVLAVVTAGLCVRSAFFHPWLSLNTCMARPTENDGKRVTQFHEPKIATIFGDGFLLTQKKGPSIRVFCDTTGLVEGEFVGIKAVFHKEGYLDEAVTQVARLRREKIAVSIVTAVAVCFFFLLRFRWNWRECRLEPKKHA